MNIERSTISVLSFGGIPLASVSLSLGQLRYPHKVIRRSYPPSRQLRSLGSPISRSPKSTHRLGPAENRFNSLSYPLTDAVTLMACGACQWPNRPCARYWLPHGQRSFDRAEN